ncbi:hypothetical protein QBC39DRAFT_374581 [Podospora conica]|nr:hypothetical protein QBC39DRAFT_374581 [Schizothecium conicum]
MSGPNPRPILIDDDDDDARDERAPSSDASSSEPDDEDAPPRFLVVKSAVSLPNLEPSGHGHVQHVDLCFDVSSPVPLKSDHDAAAAAVVIHLSHRPGDQGGYHVVRDREHPHTTHDHVHVVDQRLTTTTATTHRAAFWFARAKVATLVVLIANLVLFALQGGMDVLRPAVVHTATLPIREHLGAVATELVSGVLPLFGPHTCGTDPDPQLWDLMAGLEAKRQAMGRLCAWAEPLSSQRPDLVTLCRDFRAGADGAVGDESLARWFGHSSVGTWERNLGLMHVRSMLDSLASIDEAVDDGLFDPSRQRDNVNQTARFALASVQEAAAAWSDALQDLAESAQRLESSLGAMGAADAYIVDACVRHCRSLPGIDAKLCAQDLAEVQKDPHRCLNDYLEPRVADAVLALVSARAKLESISRDAELLTASGFVLGGGVSLAILGTDPPNLGSGHGTCAPVPASRASSRPWRRHKTMWVVEDLVSWQWRMSNFLDGLRPRMQAAIDKQNNFRRGHGEKEPKPGWGQLWRKAP